MYMVQRVAFAAGLALLAIVLVNAASITTLYNTGVNNLGVATTGSAADLHWTLAGGPVYTGGVIWYVPDRPVGQRHGDVALGDTDAERQRCQCGGLVQL